MIRPLFQGQKDSRPKAGPQEASARGGRPRLPARQRRDHRYTVAVSAREKDVIEEKARRAGLKPSVYLREAGCGARLGGKARRQMVYQLSRIGVSLGALKENGDGATRESIEEVLARIRRAIKEL